MEKQHSARPLGDPAPDLFEEVLALAKKEGGKMAMDFYDEADVWYMKNAHPETPVYNSRGFSEYYYRTEELAELRGKIPEYPRTDKQIQRPIHLHNRKNSRSDHPRSPEK